MSENRFYAIKIQPIAAALGAVVTGADLRHLDEQAFRLIHRAWLENLLLVFRGQSLSPDDIVNLSTKFGVPITSHNLNKGRIKDAGYDQENLPPEITVISNVKDAGKPLGVLGDAEVVWHSDHSYTEEPAAARMLYAVEVPPVALGGNTFFMNAYATFDELPCDLKRTVSGRTIKHDNAISVTMEPREGSNPAESILESSGPSHPIISTHPETGSNSLFLGRRSRAYVNGMSLPDSEDLLNELWLHSTRSSFGYEHQWCVGDLVLWDNRCTMHRRSAFDSNARRILYASQLTGHRPYEANDALNRAYHPRFHLHSQE
ncbi:TauD/TfdA dioxygenase family protein [Paraburkholderia sp. RL17-347-BIC-D]|uniref:TauD/TfdA dioxygenase family protein n=1 Tax=Paraburkholderia sp. RL17-347-BIC-D TaxID=3031632 RepID=UPI0038BA9FC3